MKWALAGILLGLCVRITAWPYDADLTHYNLNENQTANEPAEYWGQWPNHQYFPSPENWRIPIYSLFLDRFVNGDPTNDNINGTYWEHDLDSTQMRHGGDVIGLVDTLDYLQGMGIKVSGVLLKLPRYKSFSNLRPIGYISRRDITHESAMGF